MQIHVEQGDWGEASLPDIQSLLEDVSSQFLRHFSEPPNGRIRVQSHPAEYPFCVSRASPTDDYVIWLTTRNQLWNQFAYQFAHEFCHILAQTEKLKSAPNQWFHESLCELASLFALTQMAISWQIDPPYSNWCDYATFFAKYFEKTVASHDWQLPAGISLREWLHVHESSLRADCYNRQLNGVVALELLPLFNDSPQRWQSVRFLPDFDAPFATFLSLWRDACPDPHKPFVLQIADRFGINIASKA